MIRVGKKPFVTRNTYNLGESSAFVKVLGIFDIVGLQNSLRLKKLQKTKNRAFKERFTDRPETRTIPYQGIDNLHPETKALLNNYLEERKMFE